MEEGCSNNLRIKKILFTREIPNHKVYSMAKLLYIHVAGQVLSRDILRHDFYLSGEVLIFSRSIMSKAYDRHWEISIKIPTQSEIVITNDQSWEL